MKSCSPLESSILPLHGDALVLSCLVAAGCVSFPDGARELSRTALDRQLILQIRTEPRYLGCLKTPDKKCEDKSTATSVPALDTRVTLADTFKRSRAEVAVSARQAAVALNHDVQ
ncbi:MAG: hypothetical protein JSV80_11475 [Acidobacteriota bacterium]|nr:MAG: hypothetical protein JSV80_11475 [Acidobacteriota bacterium]